MDLKKILLNIFFMVGITLAMFISFEIALRIIFPEKNYHEISWNSKDTAFQFNKDYIVSLKPNMEKSFFGAAENGNFETHWKTNKHSFRGEDLEENPDIRIIIYGDSNIQARFSNLQDTFSYKLEKYLEKHLDKNIEVVNAGVVGFGPDQSLIRFSKEADIYKPDIVIFHIFADNDFGDIIRNRLFELNSNDDLIETNFKREPDKLLEGKPVLKHRFYAFVSSMLLTRSVVKFVKTIWGISDRDYLIQNFISLLKAEYEAYKLNKPKYFSHIADTYDVDIAVFPDSESSKTKVKLMEGVLRNAKTLADEKGIEFLVVIQPSAVDLTENFRISYKDLQKFPGYRNSSLTDKIDNICKKNNIYCINLFSVFQRNAPETLFFRGGDNHWNNLGQDTASRETASYILNNILIKKN